MKTKLGENWENGKHGLRKRTPSTPQNPENIASLLERNPGRISQILSATFSDPKDIVRELVTELAKKNALIEEQKKRIEELELESKLDPLTGVYNRRGVKKAFEEYVEKHPGSPYSVLLFDIDRFKNVNDTHWHGMGDTVLQSFARKIRDSRNVLWSRFEWTNYRMVFGRHGWEEFIIILFGLDSLGSVMETGEIIRRMLYMEGNFENGVFHEGQNLDVKIRVTSSAWASGISYGKEELNSAMEQADKAMHRAKDNGRDRISGPYFEDPIS